ncbi:hypothetical protein D9756_006980 [Leucocoprinus leucothites]|uniref:Uncharacterized protein n=1 Tax=Leucocoprinus leucothites TaxID=201217 RepID=A0A8H5FZ20_9AGAR|nr:hypothetical protein D9756_006980 [Leucoagaricus leucothites]
MNSDDFSSTYPAWRNQAHVSVNAQTCERLRPFLGEAYEEVRITFKISGTGEETASPMLTKTPEALNLCQLQLQPMGIQSRKMMTSRRRLPVPQIKYLHRKDGDEPEVGSLNSSTRLSPFGIVITASHYARYLYSSYDSSFSGDTEYGENVRLSPFRTPRTALNSSSFPHLSLSMTIPASSTHTEQRTRQCTHLQNLLGGAYEFARTPDEPQPGPTITKKT